MNKNLKAFLDMIAYSEGTIGNGDDGYNVIVGGELFDNYDDHPRKRVWIKRIKDYSTAAGRYQILMRYFDHYKVQLGLKDFSPESQDRIAIQLIKECKALDDVLSGRVEVAINKCRSRWASLPGSGYRQKENSIVSLTHAYQEFGGRFSSVA